MTMLESAFSFDELFFSKTDQKGIIQSGNSVFQRVSEFTWSELNQRPHNVIRHPDMPRGVFHLLWEYLRAGHPIGAFVKNRSKTGRHYWVFALAMPVADGYLSVRIKPAGPLLKIIEKEYAALRQHELENKITPKASQDLLLDRIQQLKFRDYNAFMTHALLDQIETRSIQLHRPVSQALKLTKEMHNEFTKILATAKGIVAAYRDTKYIPLNLEIQAAAQDANQLYVVANQYQSMVTEINSEIDSFEREAQEVAKKLEMGQFYIGASQLMEDVMQFLNGEDESGDLARLSHFYIRKSCEGAEEVLEVLSRLKRTCESLQMMGAGLELVRLTGKIEIARLQEASTAGDLLNELRKFQLELTAGLDDILTHQRALSAATNDLQQTFAKKSDALTT